MTIVCGFDMSESATEASRAAAAIARQTGVAMKLVHFIAPLEPGLAVGGAREAICQGIRDRVHAHAAELREHFGIEVDAIVDWGDASQGLVTVARQVGARLVVVSSLGAQKQLRWLLGSVAERVAQWSPVPVLVVRDAVRIQSWANGEKPLRALVAVDLGATSRAALKWAAGLRSIGRCDLLVTQIAWPFGEHVRLGLPTPIPFDHMVPELEEILLRDLHAWVGELPGPGEMTFAVRPGGGRVEIHLATLAAQVDPDLMVVGTHQKAAIAQLWQTSVSRGVLHHAACNVACVPLSDTTAEEGHLPTFRSVLVPTDFSLFANRAIPVAYGLVAMGGTVHLLHVATRENAEVELDPKERLRALIPRGAAARDVGTVPEVIHEEEVAAGICHAAGRLGVDAICMATHGRTGVARLALGSQAQEVVKRSRHPVVLVPPDRET